MFQYIQYLCVTISEDILVILKRETVDNTKDEKGGRSLVMLISLKSG